MPLQGNAWRNLILVVTYYLIDGVVRLPIPWIAEHRSYFSLSLILLRLVYILLNMYLIFKCYRHICPEGDEAMSDRRRSSHKESDSSKKENVHDEDA